MQSLSNIDAQLQSLTASPKPSYSIDGKSVSWGEHFRNLCEMREKILELVLQAEGPFEVRARGI